MIPVIGVALFAVLVATQWHHLEELPAILAAASWYWLLLAVLLQATAIGTLARQQRRFLEVRGGRYSLPSVVATTYAGNAISVFLPVVGPAAAAVFAYKRFTKIGVDQTVASWALAMSGIYTTVTYAAVTATAAAFTGSTAGAISGLVTIGLIVVPIVVLLVGMQHQPVRRRARMIALWMVRAWCRLRRRPSEPMEAAYVSGIEKVATLRLGGKSALLTMLLTLANILAKIGTLAAVALAIDGHVPWAGIVLAWAAGQGLQLLNLTPAGLGVVDAAIGVALVGIGFPASTAIAIVLVYRVISLWLVLLAGWITLLYIRRER